MSFLTYVLDWTQLQILQISRFFVSVSNLTKFCDFFVKLCKIYKNPLPQQHCVKWGVSQCWNHTIRTRILREYGHTRTYRVPRHATCPPRVRNRIRSDSDLTRVMENPVSGYVIGTRRVETWKFPCTFRFAANNVRYTSAWSVSLRLSFRVFLKTVFPTVVRIVSLGVLVPKTNRSVL